MSQKWYFSKNPDGNCMKFEFLCMRSGKHKNTKQGNIFYSCEIFDMFKLCNCRLKPCVQTGLLALICKTDFLFLSESRILAEVVFTET